MSDKNSNNSISFNSESIHSTVKYNRVGGGSGGTLNMSPSISLFLQENRGKRWSQEEDNYLLQQIQFLSHSDIGKYLKRSENAVISRLKKLAFHMIQSGEEIETVQNNLKLSADDIEQINNEFFVYPRKVPSQSKFILPVKKPTKKGYFIPPQTPEIQILYEIRSMLRKLLYKDSSNEYKSPKRETSSSNNRFYDLNLDDLEKKSEEFAKLNNE